MMFNSKGTLYAGVFSARHFSTFLGKYLLLLFYTFINNNYLQISAEKTHFSSFKN